ncbi:hypothetical protein [Rhodopirellula sp. MGV]|uniref:hypothetical protein n=1 Tax=Rhodopirellula sp. MGV TaxID=2023130 RepID=UPI000B97914F|nr:hypothetical protein [Rhodopirellula sp. MGV]OYP35496.1 hypothetical protein CGZ80_11680 [Rhodopirellula sp. MGV]PNY33938.1 hypothetical protein C2E31_26320 [Rhodopirellula baltica]
MEEFTDIEFDFSSVDPLVPKNVCDVTLIACHFNPTRAQRLAETFYEWAPSLGDLRSCLRIEELVFGDQPPEIDNANVVRGGPQHLMWQKEAMINHAIRCLPSHIRYVGWVDHDLCLTSRDWLIEALELLEQGCDAVQLFDRVFFLDLSHNIIHRRRGRAANGKGCPGGAWIANRSFLESLGGLPTSNIVGSGDEIFARALLGEPSGQRDPASIFDTTDALANSYRDYINRGRGFHAKVGFVHSVAYHLWHGHKQKRQYLSRESILKQHDFDPTRDIAIDDQGLLCWASNKPALHAAVGDYFINRGDDDSS